MRKLLIDVLLKAILTVLSDANDTIERQLVVIIMIDRA
ncbi:hypothetical protein ACVWXS_000681 [Lysinibacillus sp. TE18511]